MRSPAQTRRILCLWLPEWPLQRFAAARPELDQSMLLLTEPAKRGEFVRYCNRLARKRGVRAGMPASEARTFARSGDRLLVEAVQPVQDREALVELALCCERFSFRIGLEEADRPESILMDVTGVAHFFAGEQSLAEHLKRALRERRLDGRIAIGESIGLAWAAAHFLARPHQPVAIPAGELQRLESLPVAGLRLNDATRTKLQRLGIQTIRQLLALDRAALVRRLGNEVSVRLDQLTGQRPELIDPCRPLPRYRVEQRLEAGITHPGAIEQLWSRLLHQLLEMLQPRRLGALHLECRFFLEDKTSQSLTLRLCEATGDVRHLGDLLRLKLERFRLESPLTGLHMEALEAAPLEASQRHFFDGGARDHAREFAMLLNRLGSRLGEAAVVVPRLLPDPVPERAVRFLSVADSAFPNSAAFAAGFRGFDRPTALFPEPRPIEVLAVVPDGPPAVLFWQGMRYDIARHWGPERIESGWWHDRYVRRDYYRVETSAGQWLWVFRRLQDHRWFWHGELL